MFNAGVELDCFGNSEVAPATLRTELISSFKKILLTRGTLARHSQPTFLISKIEKPFIASLSHQGLDGRDVRPPVYRAGDQPAFSLLEIVFAAPAALRFMETIPQN